MACPHCQSQQTLQNGRESLSDGVRLQRYRCSDCGKRLRSAPAPLWLDSAPRSSVVAMALNSRTEGMGDRATGRTLGLFLQARERGS
ncbi:IS1/IS1595 family N-terminal zinc-binding domain-containing protein [Nodosilinea nodulosa]|uniref:IS1/IS1595 family N-terminal zinc-binding domain-containing protein n=1 Tax=Nodosilinea nodulosa TaxID=416001 RepID=UPI0012D746CF